MADIHIQAEIDYMAGMKYQEIADKHGVSINTVKSWKTRYEWNRKKGTRKKINKDRIQKKKSVRTKNKSKPITKSLIKSIEENTELTEKQKLFCLYYVNNPNATQAYLKAYGVSWNVANVEGWKMLTKPSVKAEIDKLKRLKYQSILLKEEDLVERYMRIAFSDMTDVSEWGTEEYPLVDAAGNMLIDAKGDIKTYKQNYINFKNSNQIDGSVIAEISLGKSGMKVKLESRDKALKWLSDYFNMNPMNKHKIAYDNAVLSMRERELTIKEF